MSIKPIVIIGNGPSIRGFDFNRLSGVDTMAMNAFYKVSEEVGFIPDYYALLRYYPFWGDEPVEYILNNSSRMKGCFYVARTEDGEEGFGILNGAVNTNPIYRAPPVMSPPNELGDLVFSPTYKEDLESVLDEMSSGMSADEMKKFMDSLDEDPPFYLNRGGLKKWLSKDFDGISDSDVIKNIRWEPGFAMPKSLLEFNSCGEPAGIECIRIASILGYNLVILYGFDGGFKTDKNGNVLPSSWGVKDPFNGYPYNAYSITGCELCKTGKGIDQRNDTMWATFLTGLAVNDVKIDIYNCTPSSTLEMLEKADLDDVVKFCRSQG